MAPSAWQSLGILLAFNFAILAHFWIRGAHGACLVRLDITNSSLAFSGTSAASLVPGSGFPVTIKDDSMTIGLEGPMYFSLSGTEVCPTTTAGFQQAAASMSLMSAPSGYIYKSVVLYPPVLPAGVMGLPLNISNLAFNLTITAAAPAPAARSSTGAIPVTVSSHILEGYVYSNSPLTGGAQLQPIADNIISTTKGTAELSLQKNDIGSSILTLTVPDFSMNFLSETAGIVSGKAWNGSLKYSFSGPLTLSGIVNCPKDCGNFGRCVASNSSSSSKRNETTAAAAAAVSSTYACECECGWAVSSKTGRCDIPAGTCPVYTGAAAALPLMNGSSSRASSKESNQQAACSDGGVVAATAGQCPNHYGFDVFTKTCSRCSEGFGGPGCRLCTTDAACQVSWDCPTAMHTCSTVHVLLSTSPCSPQHVSAWQLRLQEGLTFSDFLQPLAP
jgi:hypothetical protein